MDTERIIAAIEGLQGVVDELRTAVSGETEEIPEGKGMEETPMEKPVAKISVGVGRRNPMGKMMGGE